MTAAHPAQAFTDNPDDRLLTRLFYVRLLIVDLALLGVAGVVLGAHQGVWIGVAAGIAAAVIAAMLLIPVHRLARSTRRTHAESTTR